MIRINAKELFALLVLFEIGTTPIFAVGIQARQDAWIAILVSMLCGFVMLWIWLEIQKHFPDKNWVEIMIELLGAWLAIPLAILYVMYWNHIACFNLREFGDLMLLTFLPHTPMSVVLIVEIVVAVYVLILGLEVFGRMAIFVLPFMLFLLGLVYLMVWMTGEMKWAQLLPVLGEGIKPVLQVAHPQILAFPFGEVVVFLMFWKYVHPKNSIRKTAFYAVGIAGLLLTVALIWMIGVLGVEYASNSTIPFLTLIRLINLGNIITHLDAIGTIIIFIGAFFKMTVLFYASALGICTIFKIKKENAVIAGVGVFNLLYCTIYFSSFEYHRYIGQGPYTNYVHPVFEWTLPAMILVIVWLKKWVRKMS